MSRYFRTRRLPGACLATLIATAGWTGIAAAADDELVIEPEDGTELDLDLGDDGPMIDDGNADELTIDGGDTGDMSDGELTIDTGDEMGIEDDGTATAGLAPDDAMTSNDMGFQIGLDEAQVEYGRFADDAAGSDQTMYGRLTASARWQAAPHWEVQLAGRIDAHDQDGSNSFTRIRGDYGDSFLRYRGDNLKLTLGTQTVIWGRMDEIPLSDRVSTPDLSRLLLDDLEDRRRSNPMLRAESFFGGGKLDLVWLFDFRPAELPDQDSAWYPINRTDGRILGIDRADIPPAAVRGASIDEDEPNGEGGFGARYTRTHSFADIGVTLARTRQSTPYFRADGPGRFKAEYPRSWTLGADTALDAAGITWRLEAVYNSDTPVTRPSTAFTTTPSVSWGAGMEMHPGDGDTRVNLQLIGMNLVDAPPVLDRTEAYSLTGEIEIPFDRERWRASLDFLIGIDEKDVYINPELAFLGFEPHELYIAAHIFDGSEQSLGGFYEDHSSINLGWRAKF